MKYYSIKYIDEEGHILDADTQKYLARDQLDALHQFAQARSNDILIENVEIVNDDAEAFTLKIAGWFHNEQDNLFEIYEDCFEYFAVQEDK